MHGIVAGMMAFVVNLLLLMGTSHMFHEKLKPYLWITGAVLGGLSTAACFLPGFSFLGHFPWRLVFMVLISLTVFWNHPKAPRLVVAFVLMNFSLHAIALGIGKGGVWAVGVCVASIFLMRLIDRKNPPPRYASVCITHRGRRIDLTALVDTGNTLRDPISGNRVLVVDETVAQKLVGLSREALLQPLATVSVSKVPGLRLIPYHSVGNLNGMMLGIRADEVIIDGQHCICIIAFAPQSFGQGNGYQALAGGFT